MFNQFTLLVFIERVRNIGANKRKPTQFGVWVKTMILQEGISQYELAEQIGVPKQNITRIIYGDVKKSKHHSTIVEILAKDESERNKALEMI